MAKRSPEREELANQILPHVQALFKSTSHLEVSREIRKGGYKWYKSNANMWTSFINWKSGETIPEWWILRGYLYILHLHSYPIDWKNLYLIIIDKNGIPEMKEDIYQRWQISLELEEGKVMEKEIVPISEEVQEHLASLKAEPETILSVLKDIRKDIRSLHQEVIKVWS